MANRNRSAQGKAAASAAAAPTGADKTAEAAAAAAAQAKADEEAAAAAAQAKADEEAAADEGFDFTGEVIKVVSASGNPRRRAGRAFAREAVYIKADELTAEELGAILADPQLRVSVV